MVMRLALAPTLISALVLGSACPAADDGGNETGAGSTDAGTTTTASDGTATGTPPATASETGEPVSCEGLSDEACQGQAHCQLVNGAEATPEGDRGGYFCSDISLPFACAPIDCEPSLVVVIVCSLDDPGTARWIVDGECIPPGWEECPGSTCV
jgi:hypothetical protein